METSDKNEGPCLYKDWMSVQEEELSELLHHHDLVKDSTATINEDEITALLQKLIKNFQEYAEGRRRLAGKDIFGLFSPQWCSTLENAMSWVAGCRPSSFVNLIYALCGSEIESRLSSFFIDDNELELEFPQLSATQHCSIDNLQRRTITEEDKISTQVSKLQQGFTDMPLVLIARKTSPKCDLNPDARNKISNLERAMASAMEDADELRINTVKEMFGILEPVQALEYIIAAKKFRLCVRSWGRQRDHEHGRD